MPKARKSTEAARPAPGKPAAAGKARPAAPAGAKGAHLDAVFDELVALLRQHAPPFRDDIAYPVRNKRSFQLTVPKPVVVPGSYGGKPVDLAIASVIHQKGYVGLYLMGIYGNAELKKQLSPGFLKLLKGKCCFHMKGLDETIRKDITTAVKAGTQEYRRRGYL
ncbi:MAG TPA: hypothetical protein VMT51_11930 [Dongiaceae bacterium]|nr:hypothetical protein [Dongiaceae bacterium]